MQTFDWDEVSAREYLSDNFTIRENGTIKAKPGHKPSCREQDAIEYLFEEHNYGYIPG